MHRMDELLRTVVAEGGSDLHLTPHRRPMMRRFGDLLELSWEAMDAEGVREMLSEIQPEVVRREFAEGFEATFGHEIPGVARFRFHIFRHDQGVAAAVRVISHEIPDPHDLGLPQAVCDFARLDRGMVLVTGPQGAGKSTTMAALLQQMAQSHPRHIITLEDPVEFVLPPGRSVVQQREVGRTVTSIAAGLRSAVREDPDVLMVHELRGPEVFELALEACEAGVVVLGSLPTASVRKSLSRMVAVFPREERPRILGMIADNLRGVVAQVLLRRNTVEGRVLGLELMTVNAPMAQLIREERIHQIPALIQTGRKSGNQLLDQHLMDLLMEGVICAEEAHAWARQRDVFSAYLDSAEP